MLLSLMGAPCPTDLLIKVKLLALGLAGQLLLGSLVVLLVYLGQLHARLQGMNKQDSEEPCRHKDSAGCDAQEQQP